MARLLKVFWGVLLTCTLCAVSLPAWADTAGTEKNPAPQVTQKKATPEDQKAMATKGLKLLVLLRMLK